MKRLVVLVLLLAIGVTVFTATGDGILMMRQSGEWVSLTPGAEGEVLTAHGTGAALTWEATGGGGSQNLFDTIAVSGQSDVDADTTTDTLTLAAGSNMTLTTNAGTDTVTIAASVSGSLLAITKYAPSTSTIFSTTSSTVTDLDTTNLSITFTAPASGNVIATLSAYADTSTNLQQYFWLLRDTTPTIVTNATVGPNRDPDGIHQSGSMYITGLTPSNSYTWRWAHGVTGGATGRSIAGPGVTSGTVSTSNMFAPMVMEIWEAP